MEGTTKSDPTAMVIYTMAIIPLVLMLVEEASQVDNSTKIVACAGDLTAAGTVMRLRNWWDTLYRLGHKFGYFLEGSKSCLIAKVKVVH